MREHPRCMSECGSLGAEGTQCQVQPHPQRFTIGTASGVFPDIHHRHCRLIQRGDGYGYHLQGRAPRAALSRPVAV